MKSTQIGDPEYSDEEIARRRDETIKRMINTPPQPHKPLGKSKPKNGTKANPLKKRERPVKKS